MSTSLHQVNNNHETLKNGVQMTVSSVKQERLLGKMVQNCGDHGQGRF